MSAERGISLITMGQGNIKALKRTIDSVQGICNEVIFGDLCLFTEDTTKIAAMQTDLWVYQHLMPFDFIFHNGFSETLNYLADRAHNDLVMYLNVGEVVESSIAPIKDVLEDEEYNIWWINHSVEKHRWFRVYNRKELRWSGLIHEEVVGDWRPYHKPLFQFGDTPKDNDDLLRARVYDDVKAMCYFRQLLRIADDESLLGGTNGGWRNFAIKEKDRMEKHIANCGIRYEAFKEGNRHKYINDILTNEEFAKERPQSSLLLEYQTDPKFLSK